MKAMHLDMDSLKTLVSDALFDAYDSPVLFEPDRDPRHASRPKQTHCLSSVTAAGWVTVDADDDAAIRVTVKLKPALEQLRVTLKADRQFHNEIHAYRNVVPFLRQHLADGARGPSLPAFVYGRNECGTNWNRDVIVLQDPRGMPGRGVGYSPCPDRDRPLMNYEHLAVAIGALGRFHGLSYTAKQKDPVTFRKLVGNLRELQWDEDGWLVKNNGLKSLGMRGARPLMDHEQYRDGKLKGFLSIIREADRNLKLAMTSKEPFAVICHGDFCKPNILFEYDDQGHPRDAMITELTSIR